jgi:hypothetical protein
VNRFVELAWIYRIKRIEPPQREYAQGKRDVIVEPLAIELYADARLTERLAELPVGAAGSAATRPAAAPSVATASSNVAAPVSDIPVRPIEFERIDGRVLIDPAANQTSAIHSANVRYFNFLLLNDDPALISDPEAALTLADENLIGLTSSGRSWAGNDEFERGRVEARFRDRGAQQVLGLAQKFPLPQEIVIRRAAQLEPYDFERQGFPIRLNNDGLDRVSGFSALDDFGRDTGTGVLQRGSYGAVGGSSVYVGWANSAGPLFWSVPTSEAQSIVSDHPARPNGWRPIYIGTTARLDRRSVNEQGRPLFEASLLHVGLYWDAALTQKAATLTLTTR